MNKTIFIQSYYLYPIVKDKSDFFPKLSYLNPTEIFRGLCAGFANEFLLYSLYDNEVNYCNSLNIISFLLNKNINSNNILEEYRINATKKHAKNLLYYYINESTRSHRNQNIYHYLSQYYEKIKIEEIDKDEIKKLDIEKLEKKRLYYNLKYNILNLYKNNPNNSLRETIVKKHYLTLNRYIQALDKTHKNHQLMRDKLQNDPIFISLKHKLPHFSQSDFTQQEMFFFLQAIYKKSSQDHLSSFIEMNQLYGLDTQSVFDDSGIPYRKAMTINDLLLEIEKTVDDEVNPFYDKKRPILYYMTTTDHAIAICIKPAPDKNKIRYQFFDPNDGLIEFSEKIEFNEYIRSIFKNNRYRTDRNVFGNKLLYTTRLYKSDNNDFKKEIKTLNFDDIHITENTLLAKNKVSIPLNESENNRIKYIHFNTDLNIAKIEVTLGRKKFYLYTEVLDSIDLHEKIKENTEFLSQLNSDVYIKKYNYNIHLINNNTTINKYFQKNKVIEPLLKPTMENQRKEIMSILSTPLTRLDINSDYIHTHDDDYPPYTLAGDNEKYQLPADFNQWSNPLEDEKEIKSQSDYQKNKPTSSNYDHDIIIQLGNDKAVSHSVALAMLKHPEKSIVIQYNMQTLQYNTLKGDLNNIKTGKTRWILMGHGSVIREIDSSENENHSSQQFSKKNN